MRLTAGAAALVLALTCALPALAARKTGYAAYTDIVADINGHPIRSYNVQGYTALVAEDLRTYGFVAIWNPERRTLSVSRARGRDGGPAMPSSWPDYRPGPLTHAIGSRARDIFATDIVTDVAGKQVESFCLDGETLIRIDDLAPYGKVTWNPEERTISLTLGDPQAIRLESLKGEAEQWKQTGGARSSWEIFEGKKGALFTASLTGTPQGNTSRLVYVDRLGNALDLLSLLPQGAAAHALPRNIVLSQEDVITFDTPILETLPGTGETRDWGDTRCTVWPDIPRVEYFPLQGALSDWSARYESGSWTRSPEELDVSVGRVAGAGTLVNQGEVRLPGDTGDVTLTMTQDTVTISLRDRFVLDAAFAGTGFGRAWGALNALKLPGVTDPDFRPGNTPEQRAAVSPYFQVTRNGQPLSGSAWWSRGNGHADLNFDFDSPVTLAEGDILRVRLAMPG